VEEHYKNIKIQKYKNMYMDIARRVALMSHCARRKVGAVLERDGRIISMGWNGTRAGENNICEDSDGLTLASVVHAEENCLKKMITSNDTSVNAILYVTTAPCENCAARLVDAGITKVFYDDVYRNACGLNYLEKHGVEIEKITISEKE